MSSAETRINGQTTNVTGVGAVTLISNHSGVLDRVLIGGTFVGGVNFYDSSSTTGTAAGNLLFSFSDPTTTFPTVIPLGIQYRNGLVCTTTGTIAAASSLIVVSD